MPSKFLVFALTLFTTTIAFAMPAPEAKNARKWREILWGQALKQSAKITPAWDPSQRDCAGFIRFLYRTSISGQAQMWMNAKGEVVDYVSARDLIQNNFELVTREPQPSQVKTGDVLVYFRPFYAREDAWHLMVVLEEQSMTTQKPLVIYHNGSRGPDAVIRKVWLDVMQNPTWGTWRPNPSNLYFQGLYRWKGWNNPAFRQKVLASSQGTRQGSSR